MGRSGRTRGGRNSLGGGRMNTRASGAVTESLTQPYTPLRSSAPTVPADDAAMDVAPPSRRLRRSRSVPAISQDRMDAEEPPIHLEETTRGQILQRHKREYKSLRDQIGKMKEDRRKLNKKDPEQNYQKKEMGKEIKDLQEALARRHQRELAAFDSGRARKKPTESVHLDLQSINLNFSSLKLK
eukprot:TRINITY_DN277_c0_g1_i1.p1 TRINITY_DN277_c0_g1~~TRINITY_DN277_c0_g1_i1.p1  ORF type:complete len:184 (-),score=30.20 TRINITY_DN277_c0_g1_i1:448-999(-)